VTSDWGRRRWRYWAAGLIVLVVIPLLGAGAMYLKYTSIRTCTLVAGSSWLSVHVDPAVASRVAVVSVDLTQGDRWAKSRFFPRSPDPGPHLSRPSVLVVRSGAAFSLNGRPALGTMQEKWDPDLPASLVLEGRGPLGEVVYRSRETFTFDHAYPNGEGCGPPELVHTGGLNSFDVV